MLKVTDTQGDDNDHEILLQLLHWKTLEKVGEWLPFVGERI